MVTPLDICICTHNPRRDILDLVLQSIAQQTVEKSLYRVLIVDNCSAPALEPQDFASLANNGVTFRIVKEPRLGIVHARSRAIRETGEQWMLFVDDDNELDHYFVRKGLEIINQHSDLGCFGGKLLLPRYLIPPRWTKHLLPYLGIRDHGNSRITAKANHWGLWEPPTAGAFVRRSLLQLYLDRVNIDDTTHKLGRAGRKSLASCEDSLLMRGAYLADLASSYEPSLVLYHHLDPKRFSFSYFKRLMYAYGKSHVVLESLLGTVQGVPAYYAGLPALVRLLIWSFLKNVRFSFRHAICMSAYHLGAYAEWKQL
jgi:glycosyltransferase involved in cell wall biosynthesis